MAADISVLRSDYDQLRAQLEALLAQPEKDMAEVDHLVDALERVQLDIKAELGLKAIIRMSDPTQAAPQYPQAGPRYAEMVRINRLTNVGDFYARRRTLLRGRYLHH